MHVAGAYVARTECAGERGYLCVENVAYGPADSLSTVGSSSVPEPESTVKVENSFILDSEEGYLTGIDGKVTVISTIVGFPHDDSLSGVLLAGCHDSVDNGLNSWE